MAVRDESHRFATGFHKLLRDREAAASVLEKVKGIGAKKARLLLLKFGSLEALGRADAEAIARTARVKDEIARGILSRIQELLGER